MRIRTAKFGRLKVAASVMPLALVAAVFTVPAHGDGEGGVGPMTFDSIGSMLMDMDRDIGRERLVTQMESYDDLPRLEAQTRATSCQTQDLNNRLQEVYTDLRERIAGVDLGEDAHNLEDARRSAMKAAQELRKTITNLKHQAAHEEFADNTMVMAAEAALHAAESALESAP